MSEVTVLGLCTDNLVSIIQPSSTVECAFGTGNGCCGSGGSNASQASYTVYGTYDTTTHLSNYVLPLNTSGPSIITGNVQISIDNWTSSGSGTYGIMNVRIYSANFQNSYLVPAGTPSVSGGTLSIPFTATALTNSITVEVSDQGAFTFTYSPTPIAIQYTVLSL
jgi:hypothetical protein